MKKVILIDCYGLFYKAYYAFFKNPLINNQGKETSVIYSFFTTLYKVINEREHHCLICTLDSKGKTIRHELYKEYKANRPPMPESLSEQISIIIKILKLLGIPIVSKTSLEADDIMAFYAQQSNNMVEIFSQDKDLFQLVNEKINILQLDSKNQEYIIFDEKQVKEKFKVAPKNIADYLSLVGDSSDNVPGVKGIGNKTALILIEEFGDIDSIYNSLDKIPDKFSKKLINDKESAFLSKKLVSLDNQKERLDKDLINDLPAIESLNYEICQVEEVIDVWKSYECLSLIKKYGLNDQIKEKSIFQIINSNQSKQEVIEDKVGQNFLQDFTRHNLESEHWSILVEEIKKHGEFVFDLETTSLIPFDAEIVACVYVLPNKQSYYLPIVTLKENHEEKWLKSFKGIFEDPQIKKVGHNLKFEYTILKQKNIDLQGIEHDTMIHAYMSDPDLNAFKLEDLIKKIFGIEKIGYKEMSKGYEHILDLPEETLRNYTFEDGEYTFLVYQNQITNNCLNEKEKELYKHWEIPLLKVLGNMELTGVSIDKNYLNRLGKILTVSLSFLEKEIYKLAEVEFNINSTKQLQAILFENLGIKPIKKTKTGYSTDSYVLERLALTYPIAESLVQYRKTTKLLNTYVLTLPKLIHPKTGRIHTHYNQSVTATGRLSSTNPNLQNIPVSDGNQGIRHAFIVDSEYDMISIDYSQVELRIVGFLSKDPKLLGAYLNNQDIHNQTAHLIFNKPLEKITPEERNIAKTINFSVIYGISAFSLGEDLKVSRSDAQFFIDTFFSNYSAVKIYQEKILNQARTKNWVETYFGRRRYIKEINSSNMNVKNRAERIAFNTVIQGTASDIIKRAMVNIEKKINKRPIKMVMQVHDELVFYVPSKSVEEVIPFLEKELIDIKPFDKILVVNTKVGKYWGSSSRLSKL